MDNIGVYDDVLGQDLCNLIIEEVENDDNVGEIGTIFSKDFNDEIYPILHKIIVENLQKFIEEFDINSFPDDWGLEPFHVKGYSFNEDFPEHRQIDVGNHDMARRFLGIFWTLNSVGDDNGEIRFYRQDNTIIPKTGSMFIYPSLWTHPQLRVMPKSGTEFVMGTYLHYT